MTIYNCYFKRSSSLRTSMEIPRALIHIVGSSILHGLQVILSTSCSLEHELLSFGNHRFFFQLESTFCCTRSARGHQLHVQTTVLTLDAIGLSGVKCANHRIGNSLELPLTIITFAFVTIEN